MNASDYQIIRQLFDDYLRMYSTRDDRLTTYFSEDFSGFTGGGDFLVKNREEWVAITRQDFAQVKDPIRIELKDLAIQSLADTIAVATGFFTIHLPIEDHILSRETARLVLIFRSESAGWKISHSSISIPYYLVREGEIYPMKELVDRNQFLEKLVAERTNQLSEANDNLRQANEKLAREIAERMKSEDALKNSLSLLGASLESTADGILIVDRQGKIARWNMKFAEMWKIPEEVLSNQDDANTINSICSQIVSPDKFKGKVGELYQQPDQSSFDQIDFLDGRVFERYSQPQRIEDAIVGRVWSFRDITKRKKVEADKTRLLLRQRAILDNLPMMAWLKDTESRLEMINEPYAKVCGHTIDECIGKTDLDLFPEEMAKGYMADDHEVCVSGQRKHVEEKISSPNGIKWHHTYKTPIYDENGLIIGTAGIAQDITERKQAEEKLSYSRSLTNAALESTADGILIVGLDGKIARWNQKFIDIFHVPTKLLELIIDEPVLNHVTAQMASPNDFLTKVMDLYAHPEESSEDTLHLADGRVIDRYSQPNVINLKDWLVI